MTRRRLSLTKRKSEQEDLEIGVPARKQPKLSEPEPARMAQQASKAPARSSQRVSRLQPPSTRSSLPKKRELAPASSLDKVSGIPGPSSTAPHLTSTSTSTGGGRSSHALSTITNSPKKSVPPPKGLKKIPAPSKPRFSPELPKANAATLGKDRLKQSREQVNECKQS